MFFSSWCARLGGSRGMSSVWLVRGTSLDSLPTFSDLFERDGRLHEGSCRRGESLG